MNTQIIFKPLKYCMLMLVLLMGTSCDDFLDVNTDPNAATEAPGDFLVSEASAVLQSNRNIEIGPTVSFFVQTYASNASNGGGLFLPAERYQIGPSDFGVTNNFGGIYTGVQENLTLYIDDLASKQPVRNNAIAQASLIRSYTYWYLTVLFGDVPFSEANNLEIETPVFDDQQDIFAGVLANIDAAIAMIDLGDTDDANTTADLFYGGDMQQWLQFANSLKLRILMLQYNTDTSVAPQIQALINNPNLIRSNADNFQFAYFSTPGRENQQFQLADDFSGGAPFFFSAGKQLVDVMNADNDPRRGIYFDLAPNNSSYVGVPPGGFVRPFGDVSTIGSNVTIATFPGRILTASETLFYEAEFLALQGSPVQARAKFEAGMRASISDFDTNPGAINQGDEDTYVNNILNQYDLATGDQAEQVRLIQLQEYVDSFEKVPENWTNWKRTKVPALQLPQSAALGDIIRRFPLSADEVSSNPNAPENQIPLDTPMSFEN